MATGPERSKPLHNFSLPCLKWGTQRLLRCVNADLDHRRSSRSHAPQNDAVRFTNKRKIDEVGDLREEEAAAGGGAASGANNAMMPWNLRTRRAACKAPPQNNEEERRLFDTRCSSPPVKEKKKVVVVAGNNKNEKVKFSVSLSKEEVEQDFWALLGVRPPRRPKKRPRIVQRQLNDLTLRVYEKQTSIQEAETTGTAYSVMPRSRSNSRATHAQSDPVEAALAAMRQIQEDMQRQRAADLERYEALMKAHQELLEEVRVQRRGDRVSPAPPVYEGEGSRHQSGASHLRGDRMPHMETEMDVAARGKMLIMFRKHGPPAFYGGYDPVAAAKWLQAMEKIFEVMECPDHQRLLYATYMLQGDAHEWWRTTAALLRGRGEILTWQMFEACFLDKYFPREAREQKQAEFDSLVQRNMSVDEYLVRFNELAKYAHFRRSMPDVEVLAAKFQRGLREDIEVLVAGSGSRDMDSLVRQCRQVEAVLSRCRGKQPSFLRGQQIDRPRVLDPAERGTGEERGEYLTTAQKRLRVPGRRGVLQRPETPQCDACGKYHWGVCPTGQLICYRCGQQGHYAKECPETDNQTERVSRGTR